MAPLRFCLLTTFYPPWNFGGDGIQVQRLARALAARGHEVTVVHSVDGYEAMGGVQHPPAQRDGAVRLVGVHAGRLSALATYLSGRPLLAREQIARVLAQEFDVLHFHNPSLLGGPALLEMGRSLKLYTAHEQWLVCPTHVLWQDNRRLCTERHCVRCTLRHRRPPQPWRHTTLMERAVAQLDVLIAPSAASASLHRRFAEHVEIAQLPHFLPDPGMGAAPHTVDAPYLLFAGRLEPIKGVETLLPAMRRLGDVRLVVAGSGSLEAALRREASDLPNVEFVGWQDPGALDTLIRGALAVVVPSPGHESFGLVVIEALARGVPAIVRDFGALGELAAASEAVLPYRDEDELVEAVAGIPTAAHQRRPLAVAARAAYVGRFTEDRHVRDYLALISRAALRRGDRDLAARAADAVPAPRAAA